MTGTNALALAKPPVPVHEILYVVLFVGETVTDPDTPVAVKLPPVQEVALVELQVKVEDCRNVTLVGLAVKEAVGGDET